MKEIAIRELQQSLERELNRIAQNFLRDADKYGVMAGTELCMCLFKYKEFAVEKSVEIRHNLGLTKEEIEKAIDESVSKVLRNYLDI